LETRVTGMDALSYNYGDGFVIVEKFACALRVMVGAEFEVMPP